MNAKFDFEDVVIVPSALSDIDSRSEITLERLPLFVAPMDAVVDRNNASLFLDMGYEVCMPRQEAVAPEIVDDVFTSYGLDEVLTMLDNGDAFPAKVLIDVANGHMRKLYDAAKRIKTEKPHIVLMVGNIANPATYELYSQIGVDYIRVGIGGGSACTTSANAAIHYPMGSLISECYTLRASLATPAKIVADGGFKKYADIIKALALGADYVMIGGILSKAIDSCSEKYCTREYVHGERREPITQESAERHFKNGEKIYSLYRGMSTKAVQAKWGKTSLKTAEGISKFNLVEYTTSGWTENLVDYLKSNMSYCGKRSLSEYCGQVEYVQITQHAKERFTK